MKAQSSVVEGRLPLEIQKQLLIRPTRLKFKTFTYVQIVVNCLNLFLFVSLPLQRGL